MSVERAESDHVNLPGIISPRRFKEIYAIDT
jgi:hypothetical protein